MANKKKWNEQEQGAKRRQSNQGTRGTARTQPAASNPNKNTKSTDTNRNNSGRTAAAKPAAKAAPKATPKQNKPSGVQKVQQKVTYFTNKNKPKQTTQQTSLNRLARQKGAAQVITGKQTPLPPKRATRMDQTLNPLEQMKTDAVLGRNNWISRATVPSKPLTAEERKKKTQQTAQRSGFNARARKQTLSSYDQKLPQGKQFQIQQAKQRWDEAAAKGDRAGMEKAHKEAESLRFTAGYSGGAAGNQRIAPKLGQDSYNRLNSAGRLAMTQAQMTRDRAVTEDEIARADRRIEEILNAPGYQNNRLSAAETGKGWTYGPDGRRMWAGTKEQNRADAAPGLAALRSVGEGAAGGLLYAGQTASRATRDKFERENIDKWIADEANYNQAKSRLEFIQDYKRQFGVVPDGYNEMQAQIDYNNAVQARAQLQRIRGDVDSLYFDPTVAERLGLPTTRDETLGERLLRQAAEDQAKATEGMNGVERFVTNALIFTGQSVPGMALSLIPGVGPALGLGVLGAQAGGSRAYDLRQQGVTAEDAYRAGFISGGIEALTEKLPLENFAQIVKGKGGKSALRNVLEQAGLEGSEEAVSYVGNYIADVAQQNPDAHFSVLELLENAGMGAIGGAVFGTVGSVLAPGHAVSPMGAQSEEIQEQARGAATQVEAAQDAETQIRTAAAQRLREDAQAYNEMVKAGVWSDAEQAMVKASLDQRYAEIAGQNAGQTSPVANQAPLTQVFEDGMQRTRGRAERAPAASVPTPLAVNETPASVNPVEQAERMTAEALRATDAEMARRDAVAQLQAETPPITYERSGLPPTSFLGAAIDARREARARAEAEAQVRRDQEAVRQNRVAAETAPNTVPTVSQVSPNAETGQQVQQPGSRLEGLASTFGESGAASLRTIGGKMVTGQGAFVRDFTDVYNQILGGRSESQVSRPAGMSDANYFAAVTAAQNDRQTGWDLDVLKASKAAGRNVNAGVDWRDQYVRQMDRKAARTVDGLAKALGVKVVFAEQGSILTAGGAAANAEITGNVVRIEKDNPNPVRMLIGHELTHRMQDVSPESYRAFRDYAMSVPGSMEALERTVSLYQRAGAFRAQDNARQMAMDEVTADFAGDLLENSEQLQEFIRRNYENRTLLETIRDFFRDLAAKLTGRERAQADEAVRLLEEAIKGASAQVMETGKAEKGNKNTAREGGVKKLFSLSPVEAVEPTNGTWKRGATFDEVKAKHPTLFALDADEAETRNPTQIKGTVSTYRKIYNKLQEEDFDGTILDASSGLGYGTQVGRVEFGYDVDDIEPFPDTKYKPRYTDYSTLDKTYDVIISNAVLNVIPQDLRDAMVVKIGEMLNPGGRAFINVRGTDVKNAGSKVPINEDQMEYFISNTGSYQKGFTNKELVAYLRDSLGDEFTVNQGKGFGAVSAIVTKKPDTRFSITPQADADYMAAVESGDMETAQRMVDEAAKAAGYTIKAYHGTPNGTFHVFRDWSYFTEDRDYADVYQNQGASSNGYKQTADNPKTYGVYLAPKNAFDTRIARDRKIFRNEFYRQWGNGAPLSERGLPDWTDGDDLIEFFDEEGYDYDAFYLDEGGTGGYGDEVHDRGVSIVIKESAQVKSADPVTYDDDGDVIPLSERFNAETGDIRFSIGSASWDDVPEDRSWRYRRDSNSAAARNGAAMFADNVDSVSGGYGDYAYSVAHQDLADIDDYMEDIASAIRTAYENGTLPLDIEERINEGITPEDLAAEFNPDDIVMSAEGWDNEDFVQFVYEQVFEPRGVLGVKTIDGAYVFDQSIVAREPGMDRGRYSLGTEGYDRARLMRENQELKEKLEYWRAQVKKSDRTKADPKEVRKLAKSLRTDYSTEMDAGEIAQRLQAIYDGIGKDWSYDRAYEEAGKLARDMIEQATATEDYLYAEYEPMRKFFKDTPLVVTPELKRAIPDYNEWRKARFGKLRLQSGDQTNIDQVFQEAAALWPEWFNEEVSANSLDQLERIAEVMGGIYSRDEVNPFGDDLSAPAGYLATEIMDMFWDVPAVKRTFADRAEARLARQIEKTNQAKEQGRERVQAEREKGNARVRAERERGAQRVQAVREQRDRTIAKLRADHKEKYEKALQRARERREQALKKQSERYLTAKRKNSQKQKERELRAKIQRHVKKLSAKLETPTDTKHIPDKLIPLVKTALESINLASKDMKDTKRTQAFEALRKKYQDMETGGSEVVIDPDLIPNISDIIGFADTPIANLGLEDLNTIWQTVRAIEASISTFNKALGRAKFETISQPAFGIRDYLAGRKDRGDYRGPFRQMDKLLNFNMLTPEAYFLRLGNSGKEVFRMLRDAQDRHITIMDQAQRKTREIVGKTDIKKLEKEKHTFTFDGQTVELTTAQIMSLYELMKRQQAVDHVMIGGVRPESVKKGIKDLPPARPWHLTQDQVSEVVDALTPEQAKLADELQRYMGGTMAELGNEASMEVYGYRKFTEKHYFPISVDKNQTQSDVKNDAVSGTIAGWGSARPVKPNANNAVILRSIFDVYADHVTEMANYASWLAPMENMNRIFNFRYKDEEGNQTGTMKAQLETLFGKNGEAYWKQLQNDLNNGVHGRDDSPFSAFMGTYKASAIGANIRVIAQQPTAILRAMDSINPADFVAGMARARWGKFDKVVKQYAPIAVWKDWGYFQQDTGRQMRNVLFNDDTRLQKVNRAMMWGVGKADSLSWTAIWNALESETRRKRKDLRYNSREFYEAVAERFNEVVDHTQVVDGILQRSQIMRSADGLTKMATSFMAEPTKTYNMMLSAIYEARNAKGRERSAAMGKLAKTAFALTVSITVNAAAQSLVDAIRDDDKDEDYWEKFIQAYFGLEGETRKERIKAGIFNGNLEAAFNPLTYIPYLKDVYSQLQGYSVSRMDMDTISRVLKAFENVEKAMNGEGKNTKQSAWLNLTVEVSRFLGISAANIKRDIQTISRTFFAGTRNYRLLYEQEKFLYDVTSTNTLTEFSKLILGAERAGDEETAQAIRQDMIDSGVDAEKIDKKLAELRKKAVTDTEEYQTALAQTTDAYQTMLEASEQFQALTEDQQTKARGRAEDYAEWQSYGDQVALGEKDQAAYDKIQEAEAHDIPATDWIVFTTAASDLKADYKEDGTRIDGSKKEKVLKLIDSFAVSNEGKSYMYLSQGYSEKDNPYQ